MGSKIANNKAFCSNDLMPLANSVFNLKTHNLDHATERPQVHLLDF